MNKNEFIDVLEKSLLRLPKADRDDIISDFESHFAMGAEKGQSEEDVAASLGDPRELAETYLENLPEGAKGAPAQIAAEEEPEAEAEAEAAVPEAVPAPKYTAPTYSANGGVKATVPAEAYTAAASGDKASPDAGSIVGVVFLSIAALFVLCGLAEVWFGIVGIAFGSIAGAVALPAAVFTIFSNNGLLCAGSILLCIALLAFAALAVIGAIAGVKGIIALVKIFIGFCKKILYGGND